MNFDCEFVTTVVVIADTSHNETNDPTLSTYTQSTNMLWVAIPQLHKENN